MSTQVVEELVLEKRQAQAQAQQLLAIVTALSVAHGTDKNGGIEYRLSKAAQNKANGHAVTIKTLKTGAMVITVRKEDA